jgi:uncharacterized membrane protein YjjP (DUF1212 family)
MLNGIAVGVVFGFLLATVYGAAFHLLFGGPALHVLLYLLLAWVGFLVGHFVGQLIGFNLFVVGTMQLLTASIGAWVFLLTGRWLWGTLETES